ncbi:MAG: aspartoacylase [Cytophagales bacterium]|nr:aspartoacylase [Cytophagales bacterium]
MTKVYSKALDQTIEVGRVIGHIKGIQSGPTLIFTGGIHGNEPSGLFALKKVYDEIQNLQIPIKGNFYAISGNLSALEQGIRFISSDLNRMWNIDQLDDLLRNEPENKDVGELQEIYQLIREILDAESGPFYFMDLHTTSSKSVPFLPVSDSLLNRKFTEQYPVPIILGIEEYLEGSLLSHINELGYVAFGFEGGQHDDFLSFENHIAFIYLSMIFAGSIHQKDIDYYHYYEQLAKTSVDSRDIFEIFFRFEIRAGDTFAMEPGFVNFQRLYKNQKVAVRNGKPITSSNSGRVFMPLYQSQGIDGFFTIREIPPFLLRLSAVLRKIHFDRILPLMPGIRWASGEKDTLIVNRKIARFFAKQFFHLLGYRSKKLDKTHWIMKNREAASRENEYEGAGWS